MKTWTVISNTIFFGCALYLVVFKDDVAGAALMITLACFTMLMEVLERQERK